MPAPKKYNDELRERATRLAVEARRDPTSAVGAIRRIADQLGVHPEALRVWVKQAETDASVRPGITSSDADRLAALERENRELRRANQILKSAALDSKSQGNTLGGRAVAEALAWPVVEPCGEVVEVGLVVEAEVGAFRQVLADEFVGVLVCASLPGAAWCGEVDVNAGA